MTTDERLRASDHDRDHVVNVLRDQYVEGRLTMEEFEERAGRAVEARTIGELRGLTADLPSASRPGTAVPTGPVAAVRALPRVWWPVVIAAVVLAALLVAAVISGHHVLGIPTAVIVLVLLRCARNGRRGRGPLGDRRRAVR